MLAAHERMWVNSGGPMSRRRTERVLASLLRDRTVPAHPAEGLQRFDAFAPKITAKRVMKALRREALPLADPLTLADPNTP